MGAGLWLYVEGITTNKIWNVSEQLHSCWGVFLSSLATFLISLFYFMHTKQAKGWSDLAASGINDKSYPFFQMRLKFRGHTDTRNTYARDADKGGNIYLSHHFKAWRKMQGLESIPSLMPTLLPSLPASYPLMAGREKNLERDLRVFWGISVPDLYL